MRVALFSAKKYERKLLDELNADHRHELVYFDALLEPETVSLAAGFPAVSVFTNDTVDGDVLKRLAAGGTKLVATRSTGFNQIDVCAAQQLGVKVVRVTDYSPNSVAEFGVGLLLALNRKICRAYNRTREGNFELALHCPLTPQTHHIINTQSLACIKEGALLVNTSRGGLIDTEAVIEALKSGRLGGLAIDVYEQEANLFFRDLSNTVIPDDAIQRLVSFPNVIVTGHQAFFTREALGTILDTTLASISDFAAGRPLANEIRG